MESFPRAECAQKKGACPTKVTLSLYKTYHKTSCTTHHMHIPTCYTYYLADNREEHKLIYNVSQVPPALHEKLLLTQDRYVVHHPLVGSGIPIPPLAIEYQDLFELHHALSLHAATTATAGLLPKLRHCNSVSGDMRHSKLLALRAFFFARSLRMGNPWSTKFCGDPDTLILRHIQHATHQSTCNIHTLHYFSHAS